MGMLGVIVAAAFAAAAARAGEFVGLDVEKEYVIENSWVVVMNEPTAVGVSTGDNVATLGDQMGAHDMVTIGNFVALFVKGKTQEEMAAHVAHPLVKYIEPEMMFHIVDGPGNSGGKGKGHGRGGDGEGSETDEEDGDGDSDSDSDGDSDSESDSDSDSDSAGDEAASRKRGDDDDCESETAGSWGLARTTAESAEEVDDFHVNNNWGEGTRIFILDTGIRRSHEDFGGRATYGQNFAGGGDADGHGHGTHVASTAGGSKFGFARKAELVAVAVCTPRGSCPSQAILNGIAYAADNQQGKKCVANMSLGGPKNSASNDAVNAAVDAGVTMVVAAGNENTDACTRSPASAEKAITAGATDLGNSGGNQIDIRSYFSNYGSCTDIFAPGSDITAAWTTSDTATRAVSGTSMASPHVAGVAAVYLSNEDDDDTTPQDVKEALQDDAQEDMIDFNCSNDKCRETQNLLLHVECDD